MSSLARIDFRAVIRSPLRSKRAITSPLRARSKASGLTRIRVRLTAGAPLLFGWLGPFARLRRSFLAARRGLPFRRRRLALFGVATFAARPLAAAAEARLAVRAEAPAGVDRLAAGRARVLEAALAVRAAEEVLLDRVLAVRAALVAQLAHPQLGGFDLQLALVRVLQVLRRPHDRVDGGADVGEEGGDGGAGDQERVGDPAARIEVGVDDQRQPEDDQHQQEEGGDQVEAAVGDAEDRLGHGFRGAAEGAAVYFAAPERNPVPTGTAFRTGSRRRRRRGSQPPPPRRRDPSSKGVRNRRCAGDPCRNPRIIRVW